MIPILILDKYIDDDKIQITFNNGLTNTHIDELLFFKDMNIPDYLRLFYQQSNGLDIYSEYFLDDYDDPSYCTIISCDNLEFTKYVPEGIEVVRRQNEETRLWFFVNHVDDAVTIEEVPNGINLITGQPAHGPLRLEKNGVVVIKERVKPEV